MSRKQVVLLTSAILMVILATTTVVWIQNAEADISAMVVHNITHSCVDTDPPSQSDICQTVDEIVVVVLPPLHGHAVVKHEEDRFRSTGVTSCSQCPNPPFDEYN